jgi:sterol desaturase/sphingolipid hydroxylase (fatty acid hydroxylase superfamily)
MISWRSACNYLVINSSLFAMTCFHFALTLPTGSFLNDLTNQFVASLTKNYLLIDFIEYRNQDKKIIQDEKRQENAPIERFYREFDLFVISTTFVDSLTHVLVKQFFFQNDHFSFQFYDLAEFIFISFAYEIIFDFFHYSSHLYLHKIPFLYQNFHKIHHKWQFPTSKLTFYNHPMDFFVTNSIPTLITIYVFPFHLTYFQYELIHTYKTLLEIGGHSGKVLNANSFTQMIWLPKLFSIHLKVEDHDLHHSQNNCNYAKRFILWDKVFGTYKKSCT